MSNLKFKHDVNDYATAKALYEEHGDDLTLCYNTWLEKRGEDFVIIHHRTAIIRFHQDGSTTFDAAWVSATTGNRLHHYKPKNVQRIWRDHGTYRVELANHPGEFVMDCGEKYRVFPDATVVRV